MVLPDDNEVCCLHCNVLHISQDDFSPFFLGGVRAYIGSFLYILVMIGFRIKRHGLLKTLEEAGVILAKRSDTRINGHIRYKTVTPERTPFSVIERPPYNGRFLTDFFSTVV